MGIGSFVRNYVNPNLKKMKKPIFYIMAFLSFSMVTAQDFIVDDIAYNILPGTTTVEVTKKTECYSGVVTVPETITYNTVDYIVTTIGEEAFRSCQALTAITLPNSIRSIEEFAFTDTGLRTISIPNLVTSIKKGTFGDCFNLQTVTFPNSLMSIESYAFSNCTNLETIDLPNSLESIAYGAFSECKELSSVNFGNSLTSIGENAFIECKALVSIDLPDSLISIEEEAFSRCTALKTIVIGESLNQVGSEVFSGCQALTSVIVKQQTPLLLDDTFFFWIDLSAVDLYVPNGSVAAYKATRVWKDFRSVNATLGIDNHDTLKDAISVYPAPAQNTLNIGLKASIGLQNASLLNLQGKAVKTTKGSTINISDLQSGMYILKLNTSEGVITKKVIKS